MSILFTLWLFGCAYVGYRRGFARTCLAIVSLLSAYCACFFWGAAFTSVLQSAGLVAWQAMLIAYVGIFVLAKIATELALKRVLANRVERYRLPAAGAFTGAIVGGFIGLFAVWSANFLSLTLSSSSGQRQAASPSSQMQSKEVNKSVLHKPRETLLDTAAGRFVGGVAELGARVAGADTQRAKLAGSAARRPDVVVNGLRGLMQSPQLTAFVNDPKAQHLMATNNVQALLVEPSFTALMAAPGVDGLSEVAQQQLSGGDSAEQFIASQFTYVWRRMQLLKHDPKVLALLKDPEVKALLQQKDPKAMLGHPKFQRLVAIVMKEQPGIESLDLSQYVDDMPSTSSADPAPGRQVGQLPDDHQPTAIYKWRDGDGRWRFGDESTVPEHQKHKALRIN